MKAEAQFNGVIFIKRICRLIGFNLSEVHDLISAGAVVRFLDINSGKLVGDVMRLPLDVVEIALNQLGTLTDQKLVFIDSNRDLFITPINVRCQFYKMLIWK